MKIHVLHHVYLPIKHGITAFLDASPHDVSHTQLYEEHSFPAISDIDWLIIMGGPMSTNDEKTLPWLTAEKAFIKSVIEAGKTVFGICLGAQLIADALGARVTTMEYPEFGWHSVSPSPDIENTLLADVFNQDLTFFHSHGDMFDIPMGAKKIGASQACPNQGFTYKNHVIAIQFHPEITAELADLFTAHRDKVWQKSPFCQFEHSTDQDNPLFHSSSKLINSIMQAIEQQAFNSSAKPD
ncbi:MAG TPA: type 1 glutamine amidotransferase [Cycloclasticus sp.]|jgi:GMP synthase (glutamine-hydrolysing)|nr:type 1 glutamine amidotransferase [Cycloclasticus sp.]HIL92293.1 type 1 glutamine amidotransferase [Cycloclasticus sp.]